MWATYAPYADPDFKEAFARDPAARFWEMHLGCKLMAGGKTLLPAVERKRDGGQPDICVLDEGCRIWIEAIAPEAGADGPDQVRGPKPINEGGGLAAAPVRQVQLRASSALLSGSDVQRALLSFQVGSTEGTERTRMEAKCTGYGSRLRNGYGSRHNSNDLPHAAKPAPLIEPSPETIAGGAD
jgi:hypothetical protein